MAFTMDRGLSSMSEGPPCSSGGFRDYILVNTSNSPVSMCDFLTVTDITGLTMLISWTWYHLQASLMIILYLMHVDIVVSES